MKLLYDFLAVGVAGSLGAMARLLVVIACRAVFGDGFPIATLLINLSGSFLLGWFLTAIASHGWASPTFKLAVSVGFVGAYTTFSTFAYETDALWRGGGGELKACLNVVLSIALGLAAVRLGIWTANS